MFAKSYRFFTATTAFAMSSCASVAALVMNETLNMTQNLSSSTGTESHEKSGGFFECVGYVGTVIIAAACLCASIAHCVRRLNDAGRRYPALLNRQDPHINHLLTVSDGMERRADLLRCYCC